VRRRRRGLVALAILAVVASAPGLVFAGDETLELDVFVNAYATGKLGEFVLRGGSMFSRPSELRNLGFKAPDATGSVKDDLIPLSELTGVKWSYDPGQQTIAFTASDARLLPELVDAKGVAETGGGLQSGVGASLNYDLNGTSAGGRTVGSGAFDISAFSRWGLVESGFLVYAGDGQPGVGSVSAIRLSSTYLFTDANSLRRYRLGDVISGGLSWTRPVRLGGVQLSSDYSTRPDLVTFPLPSISGAAAVPSTLDVLVNGQRLLSRQVQGGPFQIPQLPVVNGAGTVTLTVTDPLGRQIVTTTSFYASVELLAPGLSTLSAEAGFVRRDYGVYSNDYGPLAASATYRRGLTSDITVEAHAEGTPGASLAGAGVVVNVANLAIVNASAAASTGVGGLGEQIAFGVQRTGRKLSLGVSASYASSEYRDVAAMSGDPPPRLIVSANIGLSLSRLGSVGLAYNQLYRAPPAPVAYYAPIGTVIVQNGQISSGGIASFTPAQRSQLLSGSYSRTVGKVSFYATGFRDFASGGGTGILLGLVIPFGRLGSVSASQASGSSGGSTQIQASSAPQKIGDWGYNVFAATGHPDHEFAEVRYDAPWALLSAGVDRTGSRASVRAEAQGAVSFVDGALFASNPINDSFAVVDTSGLRNVGVYNENRLVGRTDSGGRLLVPDLRSFEINHLAIEPMDIPPDVTIPFTTRQVRPQDHAGIIVKFPVHVSHGAVIRLVDGSARALPVGSVARLSPVGAPSPVGYDGEVYLEGLAARNTLRVDTLSGGRCFVSFEYRPKARDIPVIGPLACVPE